MFYGRGDGHKCYPVNRFQIAIATANTATTARRFWLLAKTKLIIGRTDLPFSFGTNYATLRLAITPTTLIIGQVK